MNISLSKFCKDRGLSKTSVYRRCQELSIDTSQGLDEGAIALLEHEFDVQLPAPAQPAIAPEIMPENFIQAGELATVETRSIQLPQGFDPTAMVRFFDGVTGQATDTTSLVAIASLAIDAVESAMDSKLKEQRQKLSQAEQDSKALAEKITTSKVKLQVKALESKILAERQTQATQSAEELFAELMAMGKPAPSPPSSPSPSSSD